MRIQLFSQKRAVGLPARCESTKLKSRPFHIHMKTKFMTLIAPVLMAGCASQPPPLADNHPANPNAPEGWRAPRQSSLKADPITRKSQALLDAGQKEQEHWNQNGPEPAASTEAKTKPETFHEHH